MSWATSPSTRLRIPCTSLRTFLSSVASLSSSAAMRMEVSTVMSCISVSDLAAAERTGTLLSESSVQAMGAMARQSV